MRHRRSWTLLVGLFFLLQSLTASAQQLTSAQEAIVRASVAASSDLNVLPHTRDGFIEMARLYNLQASPNFTVWRTELSVAEIGNAIDATEMDGLSQLKLIQLQTLLSFGPVNAAVLNRRTFFGKVFSGVNGTNTLPALTAASKRFSTRFEKLFATGTGSDASPATMTFEGPIGSSDIEHAFAS